MEEGSDQFKFRWTEDESMRFRDLLINGGDGDYYEIIKNKSSALHDVKTRVWLDIKKQLVKEFPRLHKMSVYQMKNHLKALQRKYVDDALSIPKSDSIATVSQLTSKSLGGGDENSADDGSSGAKYEFMEEDTMLENDLVAIEDQEEKKYNPQVGNRIEFDDLVCLQVSNTKFRTTWQTLMREPGSELAKMCDPEAVLLRPAIFKNGAYFIDRDPERFGLILEYLRDGELRRSISEELLFGLLSEADYFRLPMLKEEVNFRLQEKFAVIRINVGGTLFETTQSTLRKEPNSVLAKALDPDISNNPVLIKDGTFFLDRNPDTFRVILEYLRQEQLNPNIICNKDLIWNLGKEAEYLKLSNLKEELKKLTTLRIAVRGVEFKESKCTLISEPSSLLARMANVFCESSDINSDGSKPIQIDTDPDWFANLWRRRFLKIIRRSDITLPPGSRFKDLTEFARKLELLDDYEELGF